MTDFEQLKILLDEHRRHMDERMDKLEGMFIEYMERGNQAVNNITKIQERQESCSRDWGRNWEQHKEFYDKIDVLKTKNDLVSGGLKVISVVLVPIFIGVIVAIVRSFI